MNEWEYTLAEGQIKGGRKMSDMIVLLMKNKYALPENQNAGNKSALMVAIKMEIITHCLRIVWGGNMSAMILLLMKSKYTLPYNRKWREHISCDHDHGAAHGMGLRTNLESKVAETRQLWLQLMKY